MDKYTRCKEDLKNSHDYLILKREQAKTIDELKEEVKEKTELWQVYVKAYNRDCDVVNSYREIADKLQAEVTELKEQIEGNKDWIRLTENDVTRLRKLLDKDRIKRIIQAFREHVEVKAKYTNDEFATAMNDEKIGV
ncbi:hypothetical protein LCGC14_0667170 [marine sediment metagenome]|uniref:Uncharacterized protein n=1 Tax=marine sediment metagenome TaxID=412755 RepID=A0A0F9QRZ1_9ZZZZ